MDLSLFRSLLPNVLIDAARKAKIEWTLLKNYILDWRQYRRQSGVFQVYGKERLQSAILKNYHRIEKGLALKDPRPMFGADAIDKLLRELNYYLKNYGPDETTCAALNALQEYIDFNDCADVRVQDLSRQHHQLYELQGIAGYHDAGGTRPLNRKDVHRHALIDFESFAACRYSVRQFGTEEIRDDIIIEAVSSAQHTPSVCNRQASSVYVLKDKEQMRRALSHQNGNRGFGEDAQRVLIVASRLRCFLDPGERYQAWIDGGMFAMTLIYALHSKGLATCCLNWSVTRDADQRLKKDLGLSQGIEVVMMIAVGTLPDHLSIAQSPRRPQSDIYLSLPSSKNAQ